MLLNHNTVEGKLGGNEEGRIGTRRPCQLQAHIVRSTGYVILQGRQKYSKDHVHFFYVIKQ